MSIKKAPNRTIKASTSKAGFNSLDMPSKKNSGKEVYAFPYSKTDAACISLAQM